MNSTLTPDQNENVRRAFRLVVEKFGGNLSAAARACERHQPPMSRFLRGIEGVSYATAALIAREAQVSLNELLGLSPVKQIQDLPGFNRALVEARRFTKYSDELWSVVGETVIQPHPDTCDTMFLMRMAEIVDGMRAKVLTSGSDTSPPSRPGGQRRSASKLRTR